MDIMLFLITITTTLASCCFRQAYPLSPDLQNKIILHYDFEKIVNRTIVDASIYNNTAVMENNVSCSNTGCGNGLKFNPGYLNITMSQEWRNIISKNPLGITIAVWVKMADLERKQPIFTSYLNFNRFHHFTIRKYRGVRWFMQAGEKKKKIFTVSTNESLIEPNRWHHLAVTFSNKTRHAKFYKNGTAVLVNKTTTDTLINKLMDNLPQKLGWTSLIGSSSNTKKQFFGEMDEFYIFNEALNKTELNELIQNCIPTIKTTPTTKPNEMTTPLILKSFFTPTQNKTTSTQQPTPTPTTKHGGTTALIKSTFTPTLNKTTSTQQPTTKHGGTTALIKSTFTPTLNKTTSTQQPTPTPTTKHGGTTALIENNISEIFNDKNSSSSLLERAANAENFLLNLTRKTLKVNESIIFKTKDALISISIPLAGFMFPNENKTSSSQEINETLTFPDEIVETGGTVPRAVVCISYKNLHKHLPKTTTLSSGSLTFNVTLHSKIIGAAVDPPLTKPLKNPIEVIFSHDQLPGGKQVRCSFWDYGGSNGILGQWSTKGCELDAAKSSPTKTVCQCNHLTNFALLLQRNDVPYSDPPLSLKIITIIGCTLSILACPLCFVMFLTLKKKDVRHYLHINLSVAIAVAQLIFIFGITETEYKALCKALAVGLHYFYLAAFFLMLSEGLHLAILVEAALKNDGLKLPVYLITSWGLPLVIVGITFGVRFDNYGGPKACFISPEDGSIYAFVGPFGLIVLINCVILVMVLRQVVRKSSLPISSKAATYRQIVRATIKSLVILFPVLSLTWIFGILYFGFQDLVLEYLHGIFSSLQGFLIFVFQYVLNTENRSAFIRASQRFHLTATSTFSNRNDCTHTQSREKDFFNKINLEKLPVDTHRNHESCQLILYRKDNEVSGSTDERTVSTFT